jgi:hypothetical protein
MTSRRAPPPRPWRPTWGPGLPRWPWAGWLIGAWLTASAAAAAPPEGTAPQPPVTAGPTAQATSVEEVALTEAVTDAFWWGDFAELQRLHALLQAPGDRDVHGQHRMAVFRRGVRPIVDRDPASEGYHQHLVALTARWARDHPGSPLAHQLHLQARLAMAWWHRGTGYANTVSPDAWKRFRGEIDAAIAHLTTHAEVALQDGHGYVQAVALGRAAGWDIDRLLALVDTGLRRTPDDIGLHRAMLHSLLPKWGGSAELVDRYINWAAEQAGPERGGHLYAVLYASAADNAFSHRLFADTRASWARMNDGWRTIVERFPSRSNINRHAYLACIARDKAVLRPLLERVGDDPVLEVWGANAAPTLDGCRRWAAEPDAPAEPSPAPAPPAAAAPTA